MEQKSRFKIDLFYMAAFLILLGIEVIIGIFVHDNFIRPYVGDVLIVVLIYAFLRIFIRKGKYLPLIIFAFAALVEIVQLFNPAELLGVSQNKIISVILGGTFDFKDLLCYLTGTALIYLFEFRELFLAIIKRK